MSARLAGSRTIYRKSRPLRRNGSWKGSRWNERKEKLPKADAHPIFQGMARIPKTPMDIVRRWFPVIIWLGFVFFMSTGTFSAENTFSVVGPILHFLFPGLSSDRVETDPRDHQKERSRLRVLRTRPPPSPGLSRQFVLTVEVAMALVCRNRCPALGSRGRIPSILRPEPHRIDRWTWA